MTITMDKPMPDSATANTLGCKCPTGPNKSGAGTLTDGFRSYTISPECKIHSDPSWWFFRAAEKGAGQ